MPLRFIAAQRLRKTCQFERVYQRRRSASDGRLLVFVCENDCEYPRVGLSVSRKVGGAVQRNLWKRRLREAFRLAQQDLPRNVDIVVVPRSTQTPPLAELIDSLVRLSGQAAARLHRRKADA